MIKICALCWLSKWRGRLCPSKIRFFYTFFALFSANSGESDVSGGIRISSLILLFWRQLSRNAGRIVGYQKLHFFFWRALLLHFWLIFKEIPDSYMLQPLFGHSWGDVKWRLFAPACPCVIQQNPIDTRTKHILFHFSQISIGKSSREIPQTLKF